MNANFESHSISRRSFLKASGVVGAASILAACGGSSSSTAASTSGAASGAAAPAAAVTAAAAAAIAAMWRSAVVYAGVEPVLIGGDGPTPGELASLAILSGAATLYLLIAPRARRTYGLWGL